MSWFGFGPGKYNDPIDSVNYGKLKPSGNDSRIQSIPIAFGRCPITCLKLRTSSTIVESETAINPNPSLETDSSHWRYDEPEYAGQVLIPDELKTRTDIGSYCYRLRNNTQCAERKVYYEPFSYDEEGQVVDVLDTGVEYVFSVLMASYNLLWALYVDHDLIPHLQIPKIKLFYQYINSSDETVTVYGPERNIGLGESDFNLSNKYVLWNQYQLAATFPAGSKSRCFGAYITWGSHLLEVNWRSIYFDMAYIARTLSNDSDKVYILSGICEGETDSIEKITVDDKDWDSISNEKTYEFFPGTLTQEAYEAFSVESQAYRGLSYLAVAFENSDDSDVSDSSSIDVLGKWTICYEIGSEYGRSWTDNPAQILWHFYLTKKGVPIDELNETVFQALYDYCTPRWSFNYVFDSDITIEEMEKIICSSFFGRVIRSQGQYKPVWPHTQAAVMNLDLTDIEDIKPTRENRDIPNKFRIMFMDSDQDYLKDSIEKSDNISISRLGEILDEETCNWITNRDEAARRCAYKYDDVRYNDTRLTVTVKSLDASLLEPFDHITITHPYCGYEAADFQVDKITQDFNGHTELVLKGYNSAVFHDAPVPDQPVVVQNLSNPFAPPPAPTDLDVTEGYEIGPDGTWYIKLYISWLHPVRYTLPRKYLIWIKHETATVYTLACPPVTGLYYMLTVQLTGQYDIVVQTENANGIRTEWVKCAHASIAVLGKTAPPSDVWNFTGVPTDEGNIELSWDAVTDPDIDQYEVRTEDANWGEADGRVALVRGLSCAYFKPQVPDGESSYTLLLYCKAVDTSGVYSETAAVVNIEISRPPAVSSLRKDVVDNNVLLRWAGNKTTFPVAEYIVSRGETFLTAEEIARVKGTFAPVYEALPGTYVYWVQAIDTAGNTSTAIAISALVTASDNFSLKGDFNAQPSWSGTLTNAIIDGSALLLPVDAAETIEDRALVYESPAAQVADDYPYVIQPALETGSYQEVFDIGSVLSAGQISVDIIAEHIVAGCTLGCTIEFSADNLTWSTPAAALSILGTTFRYVRVTVEATNGDTYAFIKITRLDVRVSISAKTDAGSGTASSSDVDGTEVLFSKEFADIESITITPSGSSPRYATYVFIDAPNPTGFTVFLWDALGVRQSGDFSWKAKGY